MYFVGIGVRGDALGLQNDVDDRGWDEGMWFAVRALRQADLDLEAVEGVTVDLDMAEDIMIVVGRRQQRSTIAE